MTTYVLGAGASFHAGYPLASTMGGSLLEFMLNYSFADTRFRSSAEYLIGMFGKNPNIEDLVTEVEQKIESLEGDTAQEARLTRLMLIDAHTHISQMLREWFRSIHGGSAELYAKFADSTALSGDTVLTFNYDDSLERELKRAGKWELSTGYGFPFGRAAIPSAVPVLKLHGSTNWIISLGGGVTSGPVAIGSAGFMGGRPTIHTVDAEHLGYKDFSGHTYPGGGSLLSMILPGRSKQFYFDTSNGIEFDTFWDSLWQQAAEALQKSDKLVICGYSMPKADGKARELLLQGTPKQARVIVVCGLVDGERIANEFRSEGFQNVEPFNNGLFKEWLDSSGARAAAA